MLDYLRIRQYSTLLENTSYPVWKNNVKKGKKLIVVLDLYVFQIKKLARRNNPESDGAASCRVSNRQRSLKKTKDGKCRFI